MNHTYGKNHYCAGGNFILVGNDIITGRVDSLQYEEDYKYTSMMEPDAFPPASTPKKPVRKSDFSLEHGLNPTYWTNNDAYEPGDCPEGVI